MYIEAAQAQTRPELNEPMSRSASIQLFSPKAKQLVLFLDSESHHVSGHVGTDEGKEEASTPSHKF